MHLYLNVTKNMARIRFILKINRIAHCVIHDLMLNIRSTLHSFSWEAISAKSSHVWTQVAAGLELEIFGFRVQVANH